MTEELKKDISNILDFLQDKVEECYKAETKTTVENLKERLK